MTGKRRAAIAAAIVTTCFGSASALGDAPAGGPGCVGHEEAFYAQLGKNVGQGIPHGVGGVAKFLSESPPDLHTAALANCAPNP